jgi:hypothetical protein
VNKYLSKVDSYQGLRHKSNRIQLGKWKSIYTRLSEREIFLPIIAYEIAVIALRISTNSDPISAHFCTGVSLRQISTCAQESELSLALVIATITIV